MFFFRQLFQIFVMFMFRTILRTSQFPAQLLLRVSFLWFKRSERDTGLYPVLGLSIHRTIFGVFIVREVVNWSQMQSYL